MLQITFHITLVFTPIAGQGGGMFHTNGTDIITLAHVGGGYST